MLETALWWFKFLVVHVFAYDAMLLFFSDRHMSV